MVSGPESTGGVGSGGSVTSEEDPDPPQAVMDNIKQTKINCFINSLMFDLRIRVKFNYSGVLRILETVPCLQGNRAWTLWYTIVTIGISYRHITFPDISRLVSQVLGHQGQHPAVVRIGQR